MFDTDFAELTDDEQASRTLRHLLRTNALLRERQEATLTALLSAYDRALTAALVRWPELAEELTGEDLHALRADEVVFIGDEPVPVDEVTVGQRIRLYGNSTVTYQVADRQPIPDFYSKRRQIALWLRPDAA